MRGGSSKPTILRCVRKLWRKRLRNQAASRSSSSSSTSTTSSSSGKSSRRSILRVASSTERTTILQELDSMPAELPEEPEVLSDDESFQSCRSSISSNGVGERCCELNSELRIYAVTWNMNGKVPYSSSLSKLLENGRGEYDLYVIGVQESPVSSLRRLLHPILGRQYSLLAKSVLGALQLYVFYKSTLRVSGKQVDKVAFRGFGSVLGRQKGAVAASFSISNSSFLFIASHFAAHEKKLEERNVQYLRARKKIFSRGYNAQVGAESVEPEPRPATGSIVDESDVVIWLGDLNYRIEGSKGLVKSILKLNLEKLLWKRDQLLNELDKGQVFNGFVEGPLVFKPTYKYDVETDDYDTSDKERVPSWTDRVLIKVKDESPVQLQVLSYNSIDGLRTSDHRPVKALLRVRNLQ